MAKQYNLEELIQSYQEISKRCYQKDDVAYISDQYDMVIMSKNVYEYLINIEKYLTKSYN